jgi:hypothetical protein
MKFITKSIIFFVVVSCILTSTVRLERNKVETHGGDGGGSGSWASGLVCPKITIKLENDEEIVIKDVLFKPTQLKTPKNEFEASGLIFTTNSPIDAKVSYIFKQVEGTTNTYLLAFRYFTDPFRRETVGLFSRHAVIRGEVLRNKKTYKVKITLPYIRNKPYVFITDDEVTSLVQIINDRKTDYFFNLENAKNEAIKAATDYLVNRDMIKLKDTEGKNLEKQKENLSHKNITLATYIQQETENLKALEKQKKDIETEKIKTTDKYFNMDQIYNNIRNEQFEIKEMVNSLNQEKDVHEKYERWVKDSFDEEKEEIKKNIDSILTLAAIPKDKAEALKREIGTDYESKDFKEKLLRILNF